MPRRVVLDTDVIVAGLASPTGASRRIFQLALDGAIDLLASTAFLLEYEAVLTRPSILSMTGLPPGLPLGEVKTVLDGLANLCVPVTRDFAWRPQARDPDDDVVLEAAINGVAGMIATFNVRNMKVGAQRFGIIVARRGDLLRRIEH